MIEFGANDGTLVAALAERGIRAIGVDLAPNITEMAREQGREVLTGAFGPEMLDELRDRASRRPTWSPAATCSPTTRSPGSILETADAILAPDGVLCLEVMYAGDLLEQLQWDTLYHEHLTFYSLGTLERAAAALRLRAGRRRAHPHARRLAAPGRGARRRAPGQPARGRARLTTSSEPP